MESKRLAIELDQETDGRWIAEVLALPGVLAYGTTREEAVARVEALAWRVVAERVRHPSSARGMPRQLGSTRSTLR